MIGTKVRTRILLLSDTHSALPGPSTSHDVAFRMPLPEADVAIHTGDLTMTGTVEEHERAVDLLKSLRAPLKIVIPGNHDLTLDETYYNARRNQWSADMTFTAEQLDHIKQLYTGSQAKAHGISYLEEGVQTFQLVNGASLTIYASAYTPEFCDWAFAYPRDEDRYNSDSVTVSNHIPSFRRDHLNTFDGHHHNIDVVMTHGPPRTILDQTPSGEMVGCDHLLRAVQTCRPLLHCFGHIHEGWGAMIKAWPTSRDSESYKGDGGELADDAVEGGGGAKVHQWSQGKDPTEVRLTVDTAATLTDGAVKVNATTMNRGTETLFVNASIMSLHYKPIQAPWLIDLVLDQYQPADLPTSQ